MIRLFSAIVVTLAIITPAHAQSGNRLDQIEAQIAALRAENAAAVNALRGDIQALTAAVKKMTDTSTVSTAPAAPFVPVAPTCPNGTCPLPTTGNYTMPHSYYMEAEASSVGRIGLFSRLRARRAGGGCGAGGCN